MYPLALPWNKSSCPLTLPWNKSFMPSGPALKQKFHALWPCPETKVSCPLALPWNKSFMPSGPALKQKFHALWPCPETKVSCPLALPFFIHYWHYLLISYHHNSVKSRLQGSLSPWTGDSGSPAASKWERGRIGTCSACLPCPILLLEPYF